MIALEYYTVAFLSFQLCTTPSMDPIAAISETRKQRKLNVFKKTHLLVQLWIFECAIYISTGKYTVNGQKFMAPKIPSTLLKNGNKMANEVVERTNAVLQTSRKKLMLYKP